MISNIFLLKKNQAISPIANSGLFQGPQNSEDVRKRNNNLDRCHNSSEITCPKEGEREGWKGRVGQEASEKKYNSLVKNKKMA
jgi:hypothetical protein